MHALEQVQRREQTNMHLEQKFTSLEEEVEVKTAKLRKLIDRFAFVCPLRVGTGNVAPSPPIYGKSNAVNLPSMGRKFHFKEWQNFLFRYAGP